MKHRYICSLMVAIVLFFSSCVEEYEGYTQTFEDLLVVEATITNEESIQEVKLSKTFKLEEASPVSEVEATVRLSDENNNVYNFVEASNGVYKSEVEFAAELGVSYVLEIETQDGRQYSSKTSKFTNNTEIEDIRAERGLNENGEDGVQILLDVEDLGTDSRYYRYEYEETYKIIAPKYSPFELHIENDDFVYSQSVLVDLTPQEIIEFFVTRHPREEQAQICFNTVVSNSILQVDASNFQENYIQNYMVRFLGADNYIISHRYSILVKQYVQSLESYRFYNTLNNLSGSESLFSQMQTGHIVGNMFSVTNPNEKVIGYFEVVPVDKKRVYFNYEDLFPDEDLPPYYRSCHAEFTPLLFNVDPDNGLIDYSHLQVAINEDYQYYNENVDPDTGELNLFYPYNLVLPECGDCTFLGETEVPDFWIE